MLAQVAEGTVTRPSGTDGRPLPVANQWVVLHRVGSDRAAPIDSVRSGRDGRFRFSYTRTGDPQALYFVSARYRDIAYFSPPLRTDTVRGQDADILVFDPTTDTSSLRMQGRHIVVSAPRGDARDVAEVFEIENGGTTTVIARDSVTPLWSIVLPEEADSVGVAPGDVSAAAVTFREGRAQLYAPLSPGLRQLVLTYRLPVSVTDVAFPMERDLSVLEVLLEEPRAMAVGPGLQEVAPGVIENRQFRRFLVQDVAASAVVRLTLPAPIRQNTGALRVLAIALAVIMVAALGFWGVRRGGPRRPAAVATAPGARTPASPVTSDVDRLVAELATLDARFEKGEQSAAARAKYEADRAALKARLERALAAQERGA